MSNSARNAILAKLRVALPESSALPQLPAEGPWQKFEDPVRRFQEVLEGVGGKLVRVATVREAGEYLESDDRWVKATVRWSAVEGLGQSTIDMNAIPDPHELENVDFAVLRGGLGVAENAAVWVTDEGLRHRVLFFIPQHLALAIPARRIVHNMHEAYAAVQVSRQAFSCFISGPSKTADIEQSLVIGAHGARSLIVFLVEEWEH